MNRRFPGWLIVSVAFLTAGACTPARYRQSTDQAAYHIIETKQQEALNRTEPFTIEPPENNLRRRLLLGQNLPYAGFASLGSHYLEPIPRFPERSDAIRAVTEELTVLDDQPIVITLIEALQIAALHNRDYQTRKENVYRTAMSLDFERDRFRNTFTGVFRGSYTQDRRGTDTVEGFAGSAIGGFTRQLQSGLTLTSRIGMDLVRLLQPSRDSSSAFFSDSSITLPLLRGSGRHIVAEPLEQAERDVLYAIWEFERYKKDFAVQVTNSYLSVLQADNQRRNQEENYRGLIASTRRARRLADAGKLPQTQVDQAFQNELRARNRWVSSQESFNRTSDQFKILLGLPTDARIELDRQEFQSLSDYISTQLGHLLVIEEVGEVPAADAPIILVPPDPKEAGPFEMEARESILLAFENRLDLRIQEGEVFDAQRKVIVAADRLRPELTLLGSASAGQRRSVSASLPDSSNRLDFNKGVYEGLLTLDLPFERTAEAINYRESLIRLEREVRDVQELEDQIKLQVHNRLRDLKEARESLKIQAQAEQLAQRRVRGTALELEAGRVQMRDLLDAQEALLTAQNALTAAMVDYRVAELGLQRDLGILEVSSEGLWHEYPVKEVRP